MPIKVKSKIWLEKDGQLVFGTGKALILKAIRDTGSINRAAKTMNMSFRHAWSYIRSAEKRLGTPLLIKVKGGKAGGGAVLTDYAKELLTKFEKLEQEVNTCADRQYKRFFQK